MTLEAGRDLDALIAETVMGWRHEWIAGSASPGWNDGGPLKRNLPYFSTDISAAWQIVEKLSLWVCRHGDEWFACPDNDEFYLSETGCIDGHANFLVFAETAPLAICRAALAAVGTTMDAK